ncbi:outer membrane porin, OprD family [Pseudomonas cuatrocienegasensis]|uniref:Outer membrane porin, OprD family n=1 Tax=Pseudomonas cuatrocienegasensis TaxID=543360 RepID=A0ABY1BNK6_9PSED|nr:MULTISPECIES: OprD family porin [Pseudomonas]OEC33710.1 porin [Pseudomonas sp. 21C1]SER25593.1 outer membrane porin, OprD family [Pseudomonas cuatrocienegasensis]
MRKTSLAVAVAASTLGLSLSSAVHAAFIEDSKAKLDLRNYYFNNDVRDTNTASNKEWGQAFQLNLQSGFTEGTVGFGVDALGLVGVRLDGGGRAGKAGQSRTPGSAGNGTLFPVDSDNNAVDEFSSLGLTGKVRYSKTIAQIGTLQPKLPVVTFNDGRLIPQTFEGAQITSNEIDNLTLIAGQLEHAKGRASSNSESLAIAGAGAGADSNKFYYGGADYKINKDLLAQYYYGNLDDFYKQHFLGLTHTLALGAGSLKSDLRYFDTSSDGNNGSAAGRADGYIGSGFWNGGRANPDFGEVDNRTWSAFFTYSLEGHALSAGYQQVSGDSNFIQLNQGSIPGQGGATTYLITDRQISNFGRAGERTWITQYGYDFGKVGVPGLTANVLYMKGDNIKSATGDLKEWERDLTVSYVLQEGTLKGMGFAWRNASMRSEVASSDIDQNRLIVSYSIPLL